MEAIPESTEPSRSLPPAARVAIGCGSGCVGLVVLQGLILLGGSSLLFSAKPLDGIKVTVDAPQQVTVGKPFPVHVVVKNSGASEVRVQNLLLRPDTALHFEFRKMKPGHESGPDDVMGSRVWRYNAAVPVRGSWKLDIDVVAKSAGSHEGRVDLQIGVLPTTASFKVEAVEAATAAPAEKPGSVSSKPAHQR